MTRIVLPLAGATILDGLAFGLLARSIGFGGGTAIAMSAFAFSGSAQFAAIGVVAAGGGVLAAVLPALLLNARSLPMGLSIASVLRGGRTRRALEAQLVIDESWAASQVAPGCFSRPMLLTVGTTQWFAWVGGTTVGVSGRRSSAIPIVLVSTPSCPPCSWRSCSRSFGRRTPALRRLAGRQSRWR